VSISRRNLRTSLIVAAIISSASVCAEAATIYAVGPVPNGEIMVNQSNGQIIQCVGLPSNSSFAPVGTCAQIGTTPSASLSGNVTINSGAANDLAVIINTATGYVTECEISNSFSGTPTGSCIEAKN
jgi:hypothetical protein